jgi:hypothetical protein
MPDRGGLGESRLGSPHFSSTRLAVVDEPTLVARTNFIFMHRNIDPGAAAVANVGNRLSACRKC